MSPTTEPTRLQLDLREDTWIGPGRTSVAWESALGRQARSASAPKSTALAECTCPTDCPRDHETD